MSTKLLQALILGMSDLSDTFLLPGMLINGVQCSFSMLLNSAKSALNQKAEDCGSDGLFHWIMRGLLLRV